VKAWLRNDSREAPDERETPVPSIRGALPDDLEAEIAAALEGPRSTKCRRRRQVDEARRVRARQPSAGPNHQDLSRRRLRRARPNAQGTIPLTNFTEAPTVGQIVEVVSGSSMRRKLLRSLAAERPTVVGDWSQISEGAVIDVRITATTRAVSSRKSATSRFIPAASACIASKTSAVSSANAGPARRPPLLWPVMRTSITAPREICDQSPTTVGRFGKRESVEVFVFIELPDHDLDDLTDRRRFGEVRERNRSFARSGELDEDVALIDLDDSARPTAVFSNSTSFVDLPAASTIS